MTFNRICQLKEEQEKQWLNFLLELYYNSTAQY